MNKSEEIRLHQRIELLEQALLHYANRDNWASYVDRHSGRTDNKQHVFVPAGGSDAAYSVAENALKMSSIAEVLSKEAVDSVSNEELDDLVFNSLKGWSEE